MRRVFAKWQYLFLALCVALLVYGIILYTQYSSLINALFVSTGLNFAAKLQFVSALFIVHITTFDEFVSLILMSLLFGINAALLVFYFRAFRVAPSALSLSGGFLGAISAFLGIGCAACGSIFLAAFASTLGASSLLALLPYGGDEIGYIGIVLITVSIVMLARAINKPPVCPL